VNRRLQGLSSLYLVWMMIFTLAPLVLVVYFAFTRTDASGQLQFSLAGFAEIFSTRDMVDLDLFGLHSVFGLSLPVPIYVNVFAKSLSIAVASTALCLVLGYPAAWILAKLSRQQRGRSSFLLFLFIMPMWMNTLLNTYAWLALLEPRGIINGLLGSFGIGPVQFLYNDFGIILGMVYNYLPFMVLPIHTVLVKIDPSLMEAADDLGAHPAQTFLRVIFPLSVPGILAGVNMVIMPAMTTFLIPDLLGGGRYLLIGNAIERQFMVSRDYGTGSALSLLLLTFVLVSLLLFERSDRTSMSEGAL